MIDRKTDGERETQRDSKRQGEGIRGGGGGGGAAASAPTVAPLESRISRYPRNDSGDLAAPYATASSSRAP